MDEERHGERRFHGRRQHDKPNGHGLTIAAVLTGFVLQFAAIVWGASQLSGKVDAQGETIRDVKSAMNRSQEQANNNSVRLGVIESKVDDLRNQRSTRR